jgi:hypothetical protein
MKRLIPILVAIALLVPAPAQAGPLRRLGSALQAVNQNRPHLIRKAVQHRPHVVGKLLGRCGG